MRLGKLILKFKIEAFLVVYGLFFILLSLVVNQVPIKADLIISKGKLQSTEKWHTSKSSGYYLNLQTSSGLLKLNLGGCLPRLLSLNINDQLIIKFKKGTVLTIPDGIIYEIIKSDNKICSYTDTSRTERSNQVAFFWIGGALIMVGIIKFISNPR